MTGARALPGQPAPRFSPGWGPHEGGTGVGVQGRPGKGPTGTRRERRRPGGCAAARPSRTLARARASPLQEGRAGSARSGGGRASRAGPRARRPGGREAPGAPLAAPLRGGAGGAAPPQAGPRRLPGRAGAPRELGLRAAGGHCGREAARRAAEFAGSAAAATRPAAPSWAYLRAPGPVRPAAAGSLASPRSGSHGLSPASPSTGRTAAGGARGGAAGRLKGQRASRARALAAPGRAAPPPGGSRDGRGEALEGGGGAGRYGGCPWEGVRGRRPSAPPRSLPPRPPPLPASRPARDTGPRRTHALPRPPAPARTCAAPEPRAPQRPLPAAAELAQSGLREAAPSGTAGGRACEESRGAGAPLGGRARRRAPGPPAPAGNLAGTAFRPGVIWVHWRIIVTHSNHPTRPSHLCDSRFVRGHAPVDGGAPLSKTGHTPEAPPNAPFAVAPTLIWGLGSGVRTGHSGPPGRRQRGSLPPTRVLMGKWGWYQNSDLGHGVSRRRGLR